MQYGDVKTQFMALLNRRDITPTLVNTFMGFGVQRIQRELRLPSMEKLVEVIMNGGSSFMVPGDLLEFISVHTNDAVGPSRLIRTDLPTILVKSKEMGIPHYYHREGPVVYVGPYPEDGSSIFVHYYADAGELNQDEDSNWITTIAPTLLIYAALSYAADYYLDDRKQLFEASYMQIAMQLMEQAQQDEVANASIRPAHYMDW